MKKTTRFLKKASDLRIEKKLEKYGQKGTDALASSTPIDSGKTASSWSYEVKHTNNKVSIVWNNSNIVNGVPIAIILQYGHGTRNGGYVQGRDYINPAMRPIFDQMLEDVWREVTKD